jgi:hypothetical protein
MILALVSAFAMSLGPVPQDQQPQIDPLKAAANIAETLNKPQEVSEGVWIRDAHAEGPLVVIGFEAAPEQVSGGWVAEFVEGMCGPEYKAAMDRLFAAGMRVRPEVIVNGKRTKGTVIERCPAG